MLPTQFGTACLHSRHHFLVNDRSLVKDRLNIYPKGYHVMLYAHSKTHTLQDFPTLQNFVIKDTLTALTSLWLDNACEVFDDRAPLRNPLGLQVTFDTLNKSYHGEWWGHLKRLYTKSPCNVALGVPGHFPEGLEFLCLHTCCPEPLTVSTGMMTNQPKAYPHRVGFWMSICPARFQMNLNAMQMNEIRLAVITC